MKILVPAILAVSIAAAPAQAQKPTAPGAPAPATGDVIYQLTPALITAFLDQQDLQYTMSESEAGDPIISVTPSKNMPASGGAVFFYECDAADNCEDLTLWAWVDAPQAADVNVVNAYNRDTRWIRAYVDNDGDAVLEMDINATGGIGTENVSIMLNTYGSILADFAATVRGG